MTREKMNNTYFEWMYNLVCDSSRRPFFRDLLSYLYDREFTYILPMDGNRAEDGINLRYRFADECRFDDRMVASYLDDRDCSILEMLIALAIRCEEHIMENPDIGNRTAQWFWTMIESLGLEYMSDYHFDEEAADMIIDRFLNREYERDGSGGLFTIEDCPCDLRSVDIWYQMNRYLNTIYE